MKARCPRCHQLKENYNWRTVKHPNGVIQKECPECADKARLEPGTVTVSC